MGRSLSGMGLGGGGACFATFTAHGRKLSQPVDTGENGIGEVVICLWIFESDIVCFVFQIFECFFKPLNPHSGSSALRASLPLGHRWRICLDPLLLLPAQSGRSAFFRARCSREERPSPGRSQSGRWFWPGRRESWTGLPGGLGRFQSWRSRWWMVVGHLTPRSAGLNQQVVAVCIRK